MKKEYLYTGHALQRMFERKIKPEEVEEVVEKGSVIEEYPDDKPFASVLALYRGKRGPLHVTYAKQLSENQEKCYIITVYRPDLELWDATFTKRRRKP